MITAFSPEEVKAVSKAGNKVLVNLQQNNYYGWKAMVDGLSVDIITANMGFISILVPAGEHEVLFSYDPVGVRIGFWISLIAFITGIIFLLFQVLRKSGFYKSDIGHLR
jgi:uncharacterized membrane protein YfhO